MAKQLVWIGDDNTFSLTATDVNDDGVETPHPFTGIYSMLLTLVGSGIAEFEYTSLIAGQVVDMSLGSGKMRLKLGTIAGLTPGEYPLRLRYKTSAGDGNPTQIVHEDEARKKVIVKVVQP